MAKYWLVEIEKGTRFQMYHDKFKVVQDGQTRMSNVLLIHGFSFPSKFVGQPADKIVFMPFQALKATRNWMDFGDNPGYYVVDSVKVTHIRPLYVGEERVVKMFLKLIGVKISTRTEILDRVRRRRDDPHFWKDLLDANAVTSTPA